MPELSTTRLSGKVALVTGASRGIGAAIAIRLSQEGAKVVLNYNNSQEAANLVVQRIKDAGGEAVALRADVGNVEAAEDLVGSAVQHFGKLDILVNNAGIGVIAKFGEIDEAQFDATINTNVKSVLFVSQAAARVFRDNQCSIVNLSSLRVRQPGLSHLYSASKAAVQTLTVTIAGALAPRGIRVNAIAPGPIKTEMLGAMAPEILKQILASTPLGRMGDPDEIARVAAFLVSDEASYITGETIAVGGGLR